MLKLGLSVLVIFLVLGGWIAVQGIYRRFAMRHPALGPYRQEGGCGGGCSCSQGGCSVPPHAGDETVVTVDPVEVVRRHSAIQESQR